MTKAGFRVIEPLGKGGTAEVVRVACPGLNSDAALKTPLPEAKLNDIDFGLLARRENLLIGGLRFPGLVRLLDYCEDPDWLLLELCEGPSLEGIGRLEDVTLALNITSAVALDLEFLRARSIIHGDLKAHNVFLPKSWREMADGRLNWVKLSDFSLGRLDSELESSRAGAGTVGYMSPEIISGGSASHASDLFALGVIAYQLLTGHHPYWSEVDSDPVRINSRILEADYPRLSAERPDLHDSVCAIVESLLAVNPADRPDSAWDVCRTLQDHGATYPFESALRPKWLFGPWDDFETVCGRYFDLSPRQQDRLHDIADHNSLYLRQIAEVNLSKQMLSYDGSKFRFASEAYWPSRHRRNQLQYFVESEYTEKRKMITRAISGPDDRVKTETAEGITANENFPGGLSDLLLPMLRPATVRRISKRLAPDAERADRYDQAARLYHQAGDLEAAERCAAQAASLLEKNHRTDEAIALLQRVIGYARTLRDPFFARKLILAEGDLHKAVGRTSAAKAAYDSVIELYQDRPPDRLLAVVYKSLGDLFKLKQDSQGALSALNEALKIYRELNDELEISHTYNNIGNAQWLAGDLAEARRYYLKALTIQRRLKADADAASSLSNVGSVHGIMGRYRKAVRLLSLSLRMKREIGDQGEIARTLNNLGYILHLQGHNAEAVECLAESLEFNRHIGSKKETLFNLENLAYLSITAGQLDRSLGYLEEGLSLGAELEDRPHVAAFHCVRGTVLKRLGRFGEAEADLDRTAEMLANIDDRTLEVMLIQAHAGLQQFIGNDLRALDLARQAATRAEEQQDNPNLLNALILASRLSEDDRVLDRGIELAKELNMERERVLIESNRLNHLLKASPEAALEQYRNILGPRLAEVTEDVEQAGLLALAARIHAANDLTQEALELTLRAEAAANRCGLKPELVEILALKSQIGLKLGEYEQAFAAARKGLAAAKQVADSLIDHDQKNVYQTRNEIKLLVEQINGLKSQIGQKR